jgi:hypothetical protein
MVFEKGDEAEKIVVGKRNEGLLGVIRLMGYEDGY